MRECLNMDGIYNYITSLKAFGNEVDLLGDVRCRA